jgi:hypothetical protein
MTGIDRHALAGVAITLLACVACARESTAPATVPASPNLSVSNSDGDAVGVSQYFADANRRALASGARVAVSRAELLVSADAPLRIPRITFANDRELRLDTRWVPRDIRRLSTDATLTYAVFAPLARATVGGAAEAAFDASFATWNAVGCSNMRVRKKALAPGQLPSFVLTGLFPPADINDVGFVPGSVFDLVFGPGASQFTIGVTMRTATRSRPTSTAMAERIPRSRKCGSTTRCRIRRRARLAASTSRARHCTNMGTRSSWGISARSPATRRPESFRQARGP